jgi:hypothetical protein
VPVSSAQIAAVLFSSRQLPLTLVSPVLSNNSSSNSVVAMTVKWNAEEKRGEERGEERRGEERRGGMRNSSKQAVGASAKELGLLERARSGDLCGRSLINTSRPV